MAVFVDTGAWFAYLVRRDADHQAARAWMRQNRQPLVTTDYILDELLTLLKIRENYHVATAAGEAVWQQRVAQIEYVTTHHRAGPFAVRLNTLSGLQCRHWAVTPPSMGNTPPVTHDDSSEARYNAK